MNKPMTPKQKKAFVEWIEFVRNTFGFWLLNFTTEKDGRVNSLTFSDDEKYIKKVGRIKQKGLKSFLMSKRITNGK